MYYVGSFLFLCCCFFLPHRGHTNPLISLCPLRHSVQLTRPLPWDLKQAALRISSHSGFYFVVCHPLPDSIHVSEFFLWHPVPVTLEQAPGYTSATLFVQLNHMNLCRLMHIFLEWQLTEKPPTMWHSLGKWLSIPHHWYQRSCNMLRVFPRFPLSLHTSHWATDASAIPWHTMTSICQSLSLLPCCCLPNCLTHWSPNCKTWAAFPPLPFAWACQPLHLPSMFINTHQLFYLSFL